MNDRAEGGPLSGENAVGGVTPSPLPSWRAEASTLCRITAPIAAGFLAEMAMNFSDTIIIGRFVGGVALGAVSLSAHVLFSVLIACMGVVSIVGAFAAQSHGAGDAAALARAIRQGFWVATLLSLPAMVVGWNLAPVLRWLGQDARVVAIADDYLKGLVWCFLPYMWFTVLRNFVTAVARTMSIMVITVAAIGVNLAIVYVLVVGAFGLPSLGVRGAGYGTSLVCWGMFTILAVHVANAPGLREYRIFAGVFRFDLSLCGRVFRLGLPAGGMSAVESGLFLAVQLLIGTIGIVALSANQIVYTFQGIVFMIPAALSHATTARVGFGIGSGNVAAARQSGFVAFGLSAAYMAVMAAMMWALAETIAGIFLDPADPLTADVVALAGTLVVIGAVFQIVDGAQFTAMGALRGLNDTMVPFLLGLLGYWVIGLTCGYVFGFELGYGAVGLWWGLAAGLTASASLLTWRFHRRTRALLLSEPR
jgi:MATE family multidrug resistance protein